jgi:FkbM family methyltransferase
MTSCNKPWSLQWAKDRMIESGAESWMRPAWMALRGKRPSITDVELSQVIARALRRDSTCIDIGAHKGLILDECIRHAPQGTIYAFEPIPYLARLLRRKYRGNSRVKLYEMALSDSAGLTTFYINTAAMGYSSLAQPDRDNVSSNIESCTVKTAKLDELVTDTQPRFIKIDVEGAELGVLRGARRLLTQSRPIVVFEHGLGGADRFGTTPEEVFDLFAELEFHVSLMSKYLAGSSSFSRSEFCDQYYSRSNYNFIAYP